MTYLRDKKTKKKKVTQFILIILLLVFLFYFRNGFYSILSKTSNFVFRPVLSVGNGIGNSIKNTRAFFVSKKTLLEDNEYLRALISENENRMANYNSVIAENESLKEILGRKINKEMVIAGILSKPNKTPYDTLLVDAGSNDGIYVGQKVFVLGNIPIGRIAEVYANSAKVVLFSTSGEKNEVVINGKNIFMEVKGRGGGNFEMILPRDFNLDVGTEVLLPGISAHVLAKVATILSDPRDSFAKALLVSPVNIQDQKFVEIEK